MIKRSTFFLLISLAICLKMFLFVFAEIHEPQAKFQNDSWRYLQTGTSLMRDGVFAIKDQDGNFQPETYRTPGYPAFLGFLREGLGLPFWGIILLQIFLTLCVAWMVYVVVLLMNPRIAPLSALIMLFDPAINLFALLLLSETLFMFCLVLFLVSFIHYIRNRKILILLISSLCLVLATYIRPISFYLGYFLLIFFALDFKRNKVLKSFTGMLIFLIVLYSFLGLWQYRNNRATHQKTFCAAIDSTLLASGLMHSYAKNEDPYTQGMSPPLYYLNVSSRSFMSLMTRPASFKYFKAPWLKTAGKIFSYPWITFWLAGLVIGIKKGWRNPNDQFLIIVVLYFILSSCIGALWLVGSRFRVPMMPFIAILSAQGWSQIVSFLKTKISRS
ncbi:MAG: glycosyltransferase family 39 protein [Candidatus Omnitrophota bacterium]